MKSLLQKLGLLHKENAGERRYLTADEAKPFFQANGVDIESVGFPDISSRHSHPLMSYWVTFQNINASPVFVNDRLKTVISGIYSTQAKCSYQDKSGSWHPGDESYYTFKIDDGSLEINPIN
ncbi:hypothetical protein J4477_01790 [Candidatus Pacearchaeota archaeon]|nr:hypothetical protein [Candidatus Pacearchaeota archaeon]